jgi:hypothetical protein
MKRNVSKKSRGGKGEKPLELSRDWQDLQMQFDHMNMDWGALAAQVDVLKDSDSFSR